MEGYDDSSIFYKLLSGGDLHVNMDAFTTHRDRANLLAGSLNNWLDGQPIEKRKELSNDVEDIWGEINKSNPDSLSIYALTGAVLEGKIGETHYRNDGSFCLHAVLAYGLYSYILTVIIKKYKIQVTEREMPLYPKLDAWFEEGFYRDALKELDDGCTPADIASMPNVEPPPPSTVIERFENRKPVYEAFRKKVTAQCDVCRELDEACRDESARNAKT